MSRAKDPTRAQLSSRLAYSAQTPAFLRKFQHRIAGTHASDSESDPEFEDDGSGRPPIPRRPVSERPPIPERPDDAPGSADEEDGDELPQVVVVKEGKHLSAKEVESEKRRAKGLAPLPDPGETEKDEKPSSEEGPSTSKPSSHSLSFSSQSASKTKSNKRKAVGDSRDDDLVKAPQKLGKGSKKKTKRPEKKLLSFGDGDV